MNWSNQISLLYCIQSKWVSHCSFLNVHPFGKVKVTWGDYLGTLGTFMLSSVPTRFRLPTLGSTGAPNVDMHALIKV